MDPQALWRNFRDTVTDHYFDMNGRVGRAQFWYFVLVSFVLAVVAAILQTATFLPLAAIYNLAVLLPSAGMGARRLQDTGRNGQMVWAFVIAAFVSELTGLLAALTFFGAGPFGLFLFGPLFGLLWLFHLVLLVVLVALIWFWCQPGDPGPNAYGPPPPSFDPSRPASPPP